MPYTIQKLNNQGEVTSTLELDDSEIMEITAALRIVARYYRWTAKAGKFIPNYSWMKQEKKETEGDTLLMAQAPHDSALALKRAEEWLLLDEKIAFLH